MADFTVAQIIERIGGRIVNPDAGGRSSSTLRVRRPSTLLEAEPDCVAFFFAREYQLEVARTRAGLLVTGEPFVRSLEASGAPVWKTSVVVACPDPYGAMAELSAMYAPSMSTVAHPRGSARGGIHPSASVSKEARLGARVEVGAHCVIEAGAEIGEGTVLYPGVYVGPGARIGAEGVLFPHVAIYERVVIGDRVRIHANTTIGSDGFGYAPVRASATAPVTDHRKIYHLGGVRIGSDVEIGACSTIDRGTLGDTLVGDRVKLDNQVHLGHNVRLDEGAIICGGTCLAGGASVGRYAYVGGMTGIANRVHIGDGAMVGALTLLTKDLAPGEQALGVPARDSKDHFEIHALLNRMHRERKRAGRRDPSAEKKSGDLK